MYLPVHLLEKIGSEIVIPIHKFNFYSTNKELYERYKIYEGAEKLNTIFAHEVTDAFVQSEWYTNYNYLAYLSFLFDNPRGGVLNIDGTRILPRKIRRGISNIIQRRPVVDALVDQV